MANNNDTKNKISIATYGVGVKLDKDSTKISDIVKQTSLEVAAKFGKRLDNKIIDSYTNLNLTNVFNVTPDGKHMPKKTTEDVDKFKELMQDNSMSAITMLTAEQGRILNYANYKSIVDNIPEMALARETYVSNILSPDDYTKSIFTIKYKSSDQSEEESVNAQLKKLVTKYQIEEKTEEIVNKTITYGDCFVAVLPYDKEIAKYIANTSANGVLNESYSKEPVYRMLTEDMHLTERMYYDTLNESNTRDLFTEADKEVLHEAFGKDANVEQIVMDSVNKNVHVRSFTDLLRNRALADNDILFSKSDIELKTDKDKKKKKKQETFAINGASIKVLEQDRIVALEVDNVCYGYYYIEPGAQLGTESPYSANTAAQYSRASNPMSPTLQPQPAGGEMTPSSSAAKNLNISDEKMNLISQILLKALSKKLNKNYIEDNKQFKDLLYNLLKQKYIFEKGVSITYFMPEEIIHFKADSIFKDVVFFAKLYLAILTNTVIIKMGRGHDKRIFYINGGLDNNHEQAIMKVMQDVKTKEFKMSNLGSISSILSLNPGIFDDYYLTQINGEKPVDIDILPGMDQEINNDFTEFLRKSMIQGTGLPQALLEAADNIEFARQITAQNANFCRRVVRQQKLLTPAFTDFIRTLYKYEYQYNLDGSEQIDDIDINNITIQFPSPGALNLANVIDMLTQIDSASDYITKRYIPDRMDQSSMDEQAAFKMRVIEHMAPQLDWEAYKDLYDQFKDEYNKELLIKTATTPPVDPNDPYANGQY